MPAKKKVVPPGEEEIVPVSPVKPVVEPVPPAPVVPIALPSSFQQSIQKPGMVQAITIMTLINGILNILYGLTVTAAIVFGTFFIGIICAPVTILPVVLGIFEIIYAVKLMANPPQSVKPSQTIAILEIVAIITGNLISMVVGILALVFYSDTNVKAYFARINRQG
jgi:hypothetical protein